jgi:hypothetical protein
LDSDGGGGASLDSDGDGGASLWEGRVNRCHSNCCLAKFRGLMYGGKSQRCDWLKKTHSLDVYYTGHVNKRKQRVFRPITAQYFPPYIKPRGISPNDSANDSGAVDPSHHWTGVAGGGTSLDRSGRQGHVIGQMWGVGRAPTVDLRATDRPNLLVACSSLTPSQCAPPVYDNWKNLALLAIPGSMSWGSREGTRFRVKGLGFRV